MGLAVPVRAAPPRASGSWLPRVPAEICCFRAWEKTRGLSSFQRLFFRAPSAWGRDGVCR